MPGGIQRFMALVAWPPRKSQRAGGSSTRSPKKSAQPPWARSFGTASPAFPAPGTWRRTSFATTESRCRDHGSLRHTRRSTAPRATRLPLRSDGPLAGALERPGGRGSGRTRTSDFGFFWFFEAANLELAVKVLDGRAINGHFWVFWAAMSTIEIEVHIKIAQVVSSAAIDNRPPTSRRWSGGRDFRRRPGRYVGVLNFFLSSRAEARRSGSLA
jgi:hypothetical protein